MRSRLKRLAESSSKTSAVDGANSSLSLRLWLINAALKSHGFLIICWINLRKPQAKKGKLMIRRLAGTCFAYLSRLFKSLAVSTWARGFGIICRKGGISVTPPLDRLPLVQPLEYWNVWASISIAQNATRTTTKTLFIIFAILFDFKFLHKNTSLR